MQRGSLPVTLPVPHAPFAGVPCRPWAQSYTEQLLCPQDWFSFWRLNCRLASYHAFITRSEGYRQEDKVRFDYMAHLVDST